MPDPNPVISSTVNGDLLSNTDIKPTGIVPILWGSEQINVQLTGDGVVNPTTFDPDLRPATPFSGRDLWFFQFPGAVPIANPPYNLPYNFRWGLQVDISYQLSTEQGTGLTRPIAMVSLPVLANLNGTDINLFGDAPGGIIAAASQGTIFPADANNEATAGGGAGFISPLFYPVDQSTFGIFYVLFVVLMDRDALGSRPNITFDNVRYGYRLVAVEVM